MIGERIGEYEIVSVIAQGGMANVYKAYQPSFERFVAIKVLPRQSSEDPTFLKRFRHEARVIAQLEHRAILPVYAFGEHDGMPYLAMRLMEAGSLRKKLFYEHIDLRMAARIIEQVAEALDYAHAQGVIHRDLKPSNILLDESGNAYLTDFGIAKILGSSAQITGEGVVGTPTYMSPEQCQGKGVTASSDIYALGVILYEMLTGMPPFDADTPLGVMYKHVREPVPSAAQAVPGLPSGVDDVIQRAMAKLPENRYPTAAALAADFRRVVDEAAQQAVEGSNLVPAAEEAALLPADRQDNWGLDSLYEDEYEYSAVSDGESGGFSRLFLTIVAGVLGLAIVLGVIGVGLVVFSWLNDENRPSIVPPLPPTRTPGAEQQPEPTITPLIVVIPGDTVTPIPTEMAGGIIEPSPIASETPLPATTAAPTATQPPAPTATSTGVPRPTATPLPATATATPTVTLTATLTVTVPPAPAAGRIAFTRGTNEAAEILLVSADGGTPSALTNNTVYDGEPDWSPDSTLVAFESARGDNFDIYVMGADGSGVRQLTTSQRPDRHPDWSPNGALIAYESGTGDESEIYVMNADGSGRTRLTNNSYGDRAPRFSPDGTQIAYMTDQRGKWEIAILAYPSGSPVAIFTCPAADCRFPAWSPDGRQIAYNTLDSTGRVADIYLLDVASGQSTRLIEGSESGRPAWSSDGLSIFFNRTVGGDTNLYRFDFSSGTIVRLTSGSSNDYGPDWGRP